MLLVVLHLLVLHLLVLHLRVLHLLVLHLRVLHLRVLHLRVLHLRLHLLVLHLLVLHLLVPLLLLLLLLLLRWSSPKLFGALVFWRPASGSSICHGRGVSRRQRIFGRFGVEKRRRSGLPTERPSRHKARAAHVTKCLLGGSVYSRGFAAEILTAHASPRTAPCRHHANLLQLTCSRL